jgi:hypothetical protein
MLRNPLFWLSIWAVVSVVIAIALAYFMGEDDGTMIMLAMCWPVAILASPLIALHFVMTRAAKAGERHRAQMEETRRACVAAEREVERVLAEAPR